MHNMQATVLDCMSICIHWMTATEGKIRELQEISQLYSRRDRVNISDKRIEMLHLNAYNI